MNAEARAIYDYVMQRYGDPRLAAEAVRRTNPMFQRSQENPFGRLGRPPEARATPMAEAGAMPMAGGNFRNMFRGQRAQQVEPSNRQSVGARAMQMQRMRDDARSGDAAVESMGLELETPSLRRNSQIEGGNKLGGQKTAAPQTRADRDKARAMAVQVMREADGQMPNIEIDDLRKILPNMNDRQLKIMLDRLKKEMEASRTPDVLDRMRPVLGSASGILAGPAYV